MGDIGVFTVQPVEHVTRQIKTETLKRIVMKCDESSLPAIKEQLIAFCGERWGTARQTAQSLLKELETLGIIFISGEDVWLYERWQKIQTARSKEYPGAREFISIADEIRKKENDGYNAKRL